MPVIHSASPAAFKQNVSTLMKERGKSPHVKDRAQALAIAYSTQRRAQHRAIGGPTMPMPGQMMPQPGMASPGLGMPPSMQNPMAMRQMMPGAMPGQMPGLGQTPMRPPGMAAGGLATTPSWQLRSEARNLAFSRPNLSALPKFGTPKMMPSIPGMKRADGGATNPQLTGRLHEGPILSAVPGRTDRHEIDVPSGAYVIPSESVAHLGEDNTLAGMKILNRLFGPGGKYDAPAFGGMMGMSPQMPSMSDAGGARGTKQAGPVPIIAAGGEYVVRPSVVANLGNGNMARGHKILDSWVMSLRKDHIRKLKKLAPPVKT